jgi:hypothetical protein
MQRIFTFSRPMGGRPVDCTVTAKIEKDNELRECLSIVGESYSLGRSGQIYEELYKAKLIPELFYEYWKRWHLNDMRPGTPQQMEIVRGFRKENPGASYEEQCMELSEHGLLVHDGCRYGTKWLHEKLPQEVIDYFVEF